MKRKNVVLRLGFNVLVLIVILFRPTWCWVSKNATHVHYYLFPNPSDKLYKEEILFGNRTSLEQSSFKRGSVTTLITHGYHANFEEVQEIVDGYLSSNIGGNYIVLDWGALGGKNTLLIEKPLIYDKAIANMQRVAQRTAGFLQWMILEGYIAKDRIHLIGYDLGAHLMGQVGSVMQHVMDGYKIPRITGLDPPGHQLHPVIQGRNINKVDGEFVDVIHTDDQLGDNTAAGHADFYPNGGHNQPGCRNSHCGHRYAIKLYASSFNLPFVACHCFNDCPPEFYIPQKCASPVLMGVYCPPSATGIYFLNVTDPYKNRPSTLV